MMLIYYMKNGKNDGIDGNNILFMFENRTYKQMNKN